MDFLTIGQYLQPTVKHAAIDRFVTPEEFADYAALARAKGFLLVSATPLTRSSYHADADFAAPARAPREGDSAAAVQRLMPTHAERQIVPYRPEQLFDLVADVAKYPQFLPWCVAARVRSRTEQELVADLTIGFGPFRETFTSRVTLDRPRRVEGALRKGPVPISEQPVGVPARTHKAARSTSSSTSNSAAASCRPPSASCSTRRSAAWSAPSTSGRSRFYGPPAVADAPRQHREELTHRCSTAPNRPTAALPPVRVNLYSDTQTSPSPDEGRHDGAEVGDEQHGDDPTVHELCDRMAALLGKEAAVFLPSGTMCNQIAILTHCRAGDEIMAHELSHIIANEGGGPGALTGALVLGLKRRAGAVRRRHHARRVAREDAATCRRRRCWRWSRPRIPAAVRCGRWTS